MSDPRAALELSEYTIVEANLRRREGQLIVTWRFPSSRYDPVTVANTVLENWREFDEDYTNDRRGIRVEKAGIGTSPSTLSEIGEAVFRFLVSQNVQIFWRDELGASENSLTLNRPVRIVFSMEREPSEEPKDYVQRVTESAAIPLETMRCPLQTLSGVAEDVVLGDKISLVRKVSPVGAVQTGNLELNGELRVLVFVSNANVAGIDWELKAEREVNAIRRLNELDARIQVDVVGKHGAGRATFATVADWDAPFHVFHFIGHGRINQASNLAELLFEDEDGNGEWRSVSDLSRPLLRPELRMVVLNGCETAAISAFACQFPAVVGMQYPIYDEAAQLFAKGFYEMLAETGQLDDAVWSGRQNIFSRGSEKARGDFRHPVLYMQSDDGVLLRIKPRILTDDLPDAGGQFRDGRPGKKLPDGELGRPYHLQLSAKGGRRPYQWSVEPLPDGLEIDQAVGKIQGTPREGGTRKVVVRVETRDGRQSTQELPLTIRGGPDTEHIEILTERIG